MAKIDEMVEEFYNKYGAWVIDDHGDRMPPEYKQRFKADLEAIIKQAIRENMTRKSGGRVEYDFSKGKRGKPLDCIGIPKDSKKGKISIK